MTETPASESTRRSRLVHEFKTYVVISAYLFVCFSVILFYDATTSTERTAGVAGISAALIKALVIGKFILVGELFKPGSRLNAPTLLHRVAWRTLGMLLILIVFKVIEEFLVAAFHGQGIGETFDEMLRLSWPRVFAPTLLMLLILIPLMTAIELDRSLGTGGLRDILLKRNP